MHGGGTPPFHDWNEPPFPMGGDYPSYEKALTASYREEAAQYRRDDEIEVRTENHRRICGNLRRIACSFGRQINVLDVGCGTGRHFHCLANVDTLVGLDISAEMLQAAAEPVKKQEISAQNIRLLCRNVYDHSFPSGFFDFIYSLGLFGHGSQLTIELGTKFHDWLSADGRLYFDTIESVSDPFSAAKNKLKRAIYPLLPPGARRRLAEREARLPFFTITREQVDTVMRRSGFTDFVIAASISRPPPWRGLHLECIAFKSRRGFCVEHAENVGIRARDSI